MIDLRRLGGILSASVLLAICLAACEAGLGASRIWWPFWLKNDWAISEFQAHETVGKQIAGLVAQGYADGPPVGILIGASHQAFAIDPPALEGQIEPRLKWLRSTVYGGSTTELEPIARLAIGSRIRPAMVLINISLRMLTRSDTYQKAGVTDIIKIDWRRVVDDVSAIRPKVLGRVAIDLISNAFNTLFPDRTRINLRLNSRLIRMRMGFLDRVGRGMISAFAPASQPWVESPPTMRAWATRGAPEQIAGALNGERANGKFDPALYSAREEPSRSLVELVRLMRSASAEVVIVIMPERSVTREATPAEARRLLATLMEDSFGAEKPRVIDLESSVPDEYFFDLSHLDKAGKALFTGRLIEELNRR
jgi:hypothetical protein